jgi:type II secretory ATPase GspE/PulE/Tfp pilus assembly ATPase PilB-like protein
MAQRLVRRLCKECAQEYTPADGEILALGLDPRHVHGRKFKQARGCRACEGTGYRGRLALFELLEMDNQIREMCFRGESLDVIRQSAVQSGSLHGLLADGARKVVRGDTSTTEVMRVVRLAATIEA